MEKIAAATSTVSEKMTSLAHRSEEIRQRWLSVIQEISEQKSHICWPLNAAHWRQPRAGEHWGADFAVVRPARFFAAWPSAPRAATEEIAGTIRSNPGRDARRLFR